MGLWIEQVCYASILIQRASIKGRTDRQPQWQRCHAIEYKGVSILVYVASRERQVSASVLSGLEWGDAVRGLKVDVVRAAVLAKHDLLVHADVEHHLVVHVVEL